MRRVRWLLVACLGVGCGLDAIPQPPAEKTADADAGRPHAADAGADVLDADAGPQDATSDSSDAIVGNDVSLPSLGDDGSVPEIDAGDDGTEGPVPADAAVPTGATLLSSGSGLYFTTTSDGYVIYDFENADGLTYTLVAQSLTDPAQSYVIAADVNQSNGYGVAGFGTPTLIFWDSCSLQTPVCRMLVWSAATGTHSLPQTIGCLGAASPDGSTISYVNGPNANASVANVVSDTSALTSANVLEPGVGIGAGPGGSQPALANCSIPAMEFVLQGTCTPTVGFAGGQLVVSSCQPGYPNATIDSFGAPYTPAQRANLALGATWGDWSTDLAGDLLYATVIEEGPQQSSCGGVQAPANAIGTFPCVVETQTGAAAPVESVIQSGSASYGALTGDGTGLYLLGFVGNGSGLLRVTLADSSVMQLAPFADRLLGLNEDTVVFDTREQSEGGADTNLFAVTTHPDGGQAFQTLTTRTDGQFAALTPDGTHILYLTGYALNDSYDVNEGTLYAVPVAGGAASLIMDEVYEVGSPAGSQIVFQNVFGDVYYVDLAAGGTPQLLVGGADLGFGFDAALLFFSYHGLLSPQGVYSYPLP